MLQNFTDGNSELKLSPTAVMPGKHTPTSAVAIYLNTADLPHRVFHTRLLWQGIPDLHWRHLCATKYWMTAGNLTASQCHSFWHSSPGCLRLQERHQTPGFIHRTALSVLSLTQWPTHQHSHQLLLMSVVRVIFSYPLSSEGVDRQQQNNTDVLLLFISYSLLLPSLLCFGALYWPVFFTTKCPTAYLVYYKD